MGAEWTKKTEKFINLLDVKLCAIDGCALTFQCHKVNTFIIDCDFFVCFVYWIKSGHAAPDVSPNGKFKIFH